MIKSGVKITMEDKRFYVYGLFDGDSALPFYVGKGSRERLLDHEKAALAGKRSQVAVEIRRVWSRGGKIVSRKLTDPLSEEEAFRSEATLITSIGRRPIGPLVNCANGGPWGLTPEAIEKRTAARRGRKRPPEVGAKISASKMGHSVSEETRAKIRMALLGRKLSAEHCANMSRALKGKTPPLSCIIKFGALWRGKKMPADLRSKLSEAAKRRWERTRNAIGREN